MENSEPVAIVINIADGQKGRIDSVLRLGLIALASTLVVAGAIYLSIFRYGLSTDPNNWSAFGSFFGGIFSPLVAGVTLVALLKTIVVQREMIDSQREEYREVEAQQFKAFAEQQGQTELSRKALHATRVGDYKRGIMQMLEQQINYQHSSANLHRERLNTAMEMLGPLSLVEGTKENLASLESLKKCTEGMNDGERNAKNISLLAMKVALQEFASVEEVKNYISSSIGNLNLDGASAPRK
jgi:hypothetical protein